MTEDLIAFHGPVTLLGWSHTSAQGARIKLGLLSRDELAHFDKAAKRRKGHTGQRYRAAWQDAEGKPIDGGPALPIELSLIGCQWSQNRGASVLFQIERDALDALEGVPTQDNSATPWNGYVALVELGDDEQAIDQQQRERVERVIGGPISKHAARLCRDPQFHRFLEDIGGQDVTDESAAEWVRTTCGVQSRAELDHNPIAADKYEHMVKRPFIRWSESGVPF